MRLSTILESLPGEHPSSEMLIREYGEDPIVRGITYDSRKVSPGDIFIALRGAVSDGHDYVDKAIDLGAVALLVEAMPSVAVTHGVPVIVTDDSRRAMAPLAASFFGHPSRELSMVGITGTNGKTSTSYLVESILKRAGRRTGLIGTVEVRYAGEVQTATNTTPESLDLQQTLRNMCTHNVETVVMEVSSHGLELGRVHDCEFAVVALTNITQDHLDFHGDMDSYIASKSLLFRDHLSDQGSAVVNLDDPSSARFVAAAHERGARVIGVTRSDTGDADVRLLGAEIGISGSRVRLALPSGPLELELPLVGDFNLENLLVACGIALGLGIEPRFIAEGATDCPQVPGRMEVIRDEDAEDGASPTIFVDYAHTPDAVEKLLSAVRPLCRGRLLSVFGCGGDRDRAKRPMMAEAVARLSDRAIATSDNPRTEDPDAILRDIEAGLGGLSAVDPANLDASDAAYSLIPDRREAIQHAIAIARPEDSVVLAGKGHEDYQILGSEKFPFDDREEARRALRMRRAE